VRIRTIIGAIVLSVIAGLIVYAVEYQVDAPQMKIENYGFLNEVKTGEPIKISVTVANRGEKTAEDCYVFADSASGGFEFMSAEKPIGPHERVTFTLGKGTFQDENEIKYILDCYCSFPRVYCPDNVIYGLSSKSGPYRIGLG